MAETAARDRREPPVEPAVLGPHQDRRAVQAAPVPVAAVALMAARFGQESAVPARNIRSGHKRQTAPLPGRVQAAAVPVNIPRPPALRQINKEEMAAITVVAVAAAVAVAEQPIRSRPAPVARASSLSPIHRWPVVKPVKQGLQVLALYRPLLVKIKRR